MRATATINRHLQILPLTRQFTEILLSLSASNSESITPPFPTCPFPFSKCWAKSCTSFGGIRNQVLELIVVKMICSRTETNLSMILSACREKSRSGGEVYFTKEARERERLEKMCSKKLGTEGVRRKRREERSIHSHSASGINQTGSCNRVGSSDCRANTYPADCQG